MLGDACRRRMNYHKPLMMHQFSGSGGCLLANAFGVPATPTRHVVASRLAVALCEGWLAKEDLFPVATRALPPVATDWEWS
jgi:hypothetical protein